MEPRKILAQLMSGAPFQPATNLWRAVELDAVQRHGLPRGRGLDLGCGDGKLTRVVMQCLGWPPGAVQWVGVDIDPLETAQAVQTGMYERVHTGSAAAIPEPAASFDFVFSNSVLEHIPPIDEVLAEAARLLRPGGRFVFTVPGPAFHGHLAGPWWGRMSRADYTDTIDKRCAHLRYWDVAAWREHLRLAGLELTHASEYLTRAQTRRWETLSAMTGGLLHRLSGGRRPIEIQRRLRMRSERPGLLGMLGSALAPVLALGCPLASAMPGGADSAGACLLIEATRP